MIHEKMMELSRVFGRGIRRRSSPARRRRLWLEPLEDRRLLAANITAIDAFLRDGTGFRNNTPVLGEQVEVEVVFRTTDLFAASAYRIDFSIDGVTLQSGTVRSGAGGADGVYSERISGWYAEPGEHTVDVVIDSGSNVSEQNEQDNSFSFTFTPIRPTLPATFVWPETDTPFEDHLLRNYVDLDPTSAVRDWRGGTATVNGHPGLDLGAVNFAAMDAGRPVVAVADGVVVAAVDGNQDRNTILNGLPSNLVILDHGDGWQTLYVHLRRDSVEVKVGDTVQQGDMLGFEGSSGNSTASHLHFEVQHHGRPVETFLDPNAYWANPVGYVGDQPFLVDAGTTNYDPGRHIFERPSNVEVISQAAGQTSYAWGIFSGLRDGDFVEFTWLQPNGVLHARRSFTLSQDVSVQNFIFATSLPAVPELGVWTVDIRNNRSLLGRQTFEVTATGAPEIRIDDLSGDILLDERHSPVDFGTVVQKTVPPANTFRVVNHGTDTLTLGGLVVPRGFLVTDGLGSILAPGAQETFTISLNTSDAGYYAGQIQVFSDDDDEPIYNISIEGTVTSQATETLTLGIAQRTISESGTTIANVTRSGDLNLPLSVNLANNRPRQATVPTDVMIPAGESSATFTISGINDGLDDGVQVVEITASALDFADAINTVNVKDVPTLTVNIEEIAISEADGPAASEVTIVRLGGDLTQRIDIALEANDLTEAAVPLLVTMEPFQSIATVSLDAVDDDILDGTQTVILTATADGYEKGVDTVQVLDHETVAITLDAATIPEDGGAINGTITRSNRDNQDPLVVQLQSDDPSEATVPAEVTIPAGLASVAFTVTVVDDDLLDGDRLVTISSSAPAYVDGSAEILVTDAEALSLTIAEFTISENNGATTATVTRSNTNTASPLRVSLSSNDTSEAVVPAFVDIPANQMSADFAVQGVDDDILDGNIGVALTAMAAGYRSGSASLIVADHETLSIALAQTTIFEDGGATVGTVTRNNVDLSAPISVVLSSSDTNEATVSPVVVQIPSNQASATFTVTGIDDMIADGDKTVQITAVAGGYVSAVESLTVSDRPGLSITGNASVLSENSPATTVTVRRHNTDKSQLLIVTLANSAPSQAVVPPTVEIPAGGSSATFDFAPIDDDLLDGTQLVTVTASAGSLAPSSITIAIEDHETLTLGLAASTFAENSTGTTATITRGNSDIQSPLTVFIEGNDPTEAVAPTSVTIPGGAASFDFPITAVDDTLLDGTQTVTFLASAAGYQGAAAVVDVTDHEQLTVSLAASAISENGGSVTGTVTRGNTDLGLPITVALTSDDASEATVAASVQIPAQQSAATFTIFAEDDDLLDGTQSVVISASSAGYASGAANLDVTDHEALSVTLNDVSISESNGMTTGVVTRGNTDIGSPLTVQLRSSDTSEAVVVGSVEIDANERSASFEVRAVNDTLFDGDQVVTISASAPGYIEGDASLTVTDHESLSLTLNANSISERLGSTTATVSRSITNLLFPTTVTVTTDLPGRISVSNTVIIKAGQTTSAPFRISAIDNHLLDGAANATISVSSNGYQGDMQTLTVLDYETLALTLQDSQISEFGGQTTGVVRRNNVDIGQELQVNLGGINLSKVIIPGTVIIPAGAAESAPFTIFALDDNVFDGDLTVTISATAAGYEPASAMLRVTDLESLSVTIDAAQMSERNGLATGTVTRLNTDIDDSLLISLAGSDDSEATVPSTVLIGAGERSQTFAITARDDTLLDGTQTFTVTASAAGYADAAASIDVTDFETLTLTLAQSAISEMGGNTTLTVTRSNSDVGQAVAVTLAGDDPSEVSFAENITIPANSTSTTINISAVDDALLDGTQTVTLTASAAGYVGDSTTLDVTDHETLGLSLADDEISELNGSTIATITRSNLADNSRLFVTVTSQGQLPGGDADSNPPAVPATVEIPAGEASADFTIAAVDDDLLVGLRTATITVSSAGFVGAASPITIADVETLTVTIDTLPLKEGSTTTGTITRSNSNREGEVVVSLTSRDSSRLVVPQAVIIPAGQASTTFDVTSEDDGVITGNQVLFVDVSAGGYQPGSFGVAIEDVAFRWQNPARHTDVNNDGLLTPADVLALVNEINRNGARRLPTTGPLAPPPYYDVNGDGFITANDVVIAINEINQGAGSGAGGEGEGADNPLVRSFGQYEFPGSVLLSASRRDHVTERPVPIGQASQLAAQAARIAQIARGSAVPSSRQQPRESSDPHAVQTDELESLLDVLAADIASLGEVGP